MYYNVGKKIKVLAQICGWISLIGGVIALFIGADFYGGLDEPGPWLFLLCGLVGFVSSWPLYGFGQLIDDVRTIKENGIGQPEENKPDELPEI